LFAIPTAVKGSPGDSVGSSVPKLGYVNSYLMMQRLTFPFPFVHHQTHDWLLSVLEFEGGLAITLEDSR